MTNNSKSVKTADIYSVRLRALEPSDTDCVYNWENQGDMWQYGYSPAPLSRHLIWEYIQNYDANPQSAGQLRLMIIREDGSPVGAIDLYQIDMQNLRAFVGVMIAPEYRRNGYARAALNLIAEWSVNSLGLHTLAAEVVADNDASLALFETAGYKCAATLPGWCRRGREFVDVILFVNTL